MQRYLTAKSEEEAKRSLLMSAYWKIPLQVVVLLLGVLVFVFYVFHTPPLIFSTAQHRQLKEGPAAAQYAVLETEFTAALQRGGQLVRRWRRPALPVTRGRRRRPRRRSSSVTRRWRQSGAGR